MPFELLQSEILMKGRAFTIRRDTLKTPDGRVTKFDIIEHHGSVVIIPVNEKGELLFVRQYRHATRGELLELPAGTLKDSQEAPESCAAREIREETGFAAGKLIRLGEFYLAPGYSTEFMVVFLATDLRYDPLQADADEFLSVEAVPLRKAIRKAENGEVPDAKSLAALFLARPHLETLS
jgi:ADP-ribose pyrophosphatase